MALPPLPPRPARDLDSLVLVVAGRSWEVGHRLAGDAGEINGGIEEDAASTLRLDFEDHDGAVVAIVGDETQRLRDGVRVTLDGVEWVLQDVDCEDGITKLTFEDEAAWRMRLFSRYKSRSRAKVTRAEFVLELVDEAGQAPREPLRAVIPELTDRRRIARPDADAA